MNEVLTMRSPWDRLEAARKRSKLDRYWYRWHNRLNERSKKFERVFSKYLDFERKKFLAVISHLSIKAATINQTENDLVIVQKLSIQKYIDELEKTLKGIGEEFARDEFAALTFKFTGLPKVVESWLDSYEPKIVDDIGKTTIDRVMRDIRNGIEEGETLRDIEDRINHTYNDWQRSRVPFIARTEVGRIASMSQQAVLNEGSKLLTETEVIMQTWLTARDDRVRDSHVELEGEQRELDQEFLPGLKFPRDPDGDAAEVINCRCTLLAEVVEQK